MWMEDSGEWSISLLGFLIIFSNPHIQISQISYPHIQIADKYNSALYPIFPNLSIPNPYIFLTKSGEK